MIGMKMSLYMESKTLKAMSVADVYESLGGILKNTNGLYVSIDENRGKVRVYSGGQDAEIRLREIRERMKVIRIKCVEVVCGALNFVSACSQQIAGTMMRKYK